MNRTALRIFIFFGVISILGVSVLQIFWLNRAFNIENQEFNDRVNLALRRVANVIAIMNKEERPYQQVTQVSSNYFVVSMNDALHPYLLERLLKTEFDRRNINQDFEYVIYDCFNNKIVFSKYITHRENGKVPETIEPPRWEKDNHYFGVYFPNKVSYLVTEMGIWIFSTGVLLLVILFFGYSMSVILRQKKLSEIRTDFINNMTHEFKTPISTISASSDVLLSGALDSNAEKRMRYYKMIHDESDRLKLQVEKVLQMAQFDRSEIDLNLVEVDINALIAKSIAGVQILLDESKGQITLHLNAEHAMYRVDELHFSNIIRNLLDNAIKYCKNEPHIIITTLDTDSGIKVLMADNGIGISAKQQREIFEKFYRVPTGDVHNVKGFGLGLYYVKSLIEAHGGTIRVESTAEGSTFILWLPRG